MFNEIEVWNMFMNIIWYYILMMLDWSFLFYVIVVIMFIGVFYFMCLKIIYKYLYLFLIKKFLVDLGS